MRVGTLFIVTLLAQSQIGACFIAPALHLPFSIRDCTKHHATIASEAVAVDRKEKFSKLKKTLPADLDVVGAGGWYNLEKLSLDPKGHLVRLIVEGLNSEDRKVEMGLNDETLEALVALLHSMGKGFEADGVDGEWALVYSRQGANSPKLQKGVGKGEKAGLSINTYDSKDMTFSADVKILKKGIVKTKVKYSPETAGYTLTSDGKIVLRHISCQIIEASFKFWKLPRINLPRPKKTGWLDFEYMDKDIRITRGNRGGLFVHFRPDFLEEKLAN